MTQKKELVYERPMDTLRGLNVGGETMFPLAKIASVRAMCTMLKMQGIAEYRTRIDHENKALLVKRTK